MTIRIMNFSPQDLTPRLPGQVVVDVSLIIHSVDPSRTRPTDPNLGYSVDFIAEFDARNRSLCSSIWPTMAGNTSGSFPARTDERINRQLDWRLERAVVILCRGTLCEVHTLIVIRDTRANDADSGILRSGQRHLLPRLTRLGGLCVY
jgi:hypothetical protein